MTHINLMIDQTFGKPVADALNERTGAIKAATTVEYGFAPQAEDKELIERTEELGCLLLTHDKNTIHPDRYPPCTHGGVIVFKPKHWSVQQVTESVYEFCLSGSKKAAEHCFTWLYHDRALIYTHTDPLTIRF